MTHNYIPNQGTNGVFFAPLHNIRWPVRDGDQKLKKNQERSYTHEWRLNIPNGLALECFSRFNRPYIINWICLPTENCSHLTGIRPECDVFWSARLKITPQQEMKRKNRESKENERRRREKAMVALLVFIVATLVHQFWYNHFLRNSQGKLATPVPCTNFVKKQFQLQRFGAVEQATC